jgi:hypothetical protein
MEDRSLDLTKRSSFKSIAKLKMKLITIGINLRKGAIKMHRSAVGSKTNLEFHGKLCLMFW